MQRKIDNKKDILLLLLYSPGVGTSFNEPIVGRTRLVKMLFLFWKECLKQFKRGLAITEENFYEFFPWNFGPFSKEVYNDLMFFLLRGFIESEDSESELLPEAAAEWMEWMKMSSPEADDEGITEYDEQSYKLSERGEKFAKELYESLNKEQRKILRTFKGKLVRTPLKAILKYVYEKYPDFTERSHIRQQILGDKY